MSENKFWKGVVIGIVAVVGVLVLLALGMFLVLGRCPVCGGRMGGGHMPEWMMSYGGPRQ